MIRFNKKYMKLILFGFTFVVLFGCNNANKPSLIPASGYSIRMQCVIPPKSWEGPCDLKLCEESNETEGTYRVTFSNYLLDNIDFAFPWKYCDSLPVLEFEYTEHYDSLGRPKEHAIHDWFDVAQRVNLDIGDSVTFYIQLHQTYKNEPFSKHCEDFWIDSSGFTVPYQMYFYRPISKGYGFRRHNRRWSDMVRVYRRPDLEKRIEDRHLLEKARFELYKQNIGNGCEQRFIFDDTTGLNGAVSAWELEYALDTFVRHSDTIDFVFKPAFPFKGYLCRVFQLNNGPMELDSWCSVSILKNSPIPNTLYESDEKAKQITMFDYLAEEQRFLICYSEYQGKMHPWLQWYMKTRYFL